MKKPIIIGIISIFFIIVLLPWNFANASPFDPIIAGTLTMENLRIIDKGTYNQIKLDVVIRAPDIEIGEKAGFSVKSGTWLINENGKIYYNTNSRFNDFECTDKGLDMLGFYRIDGKSGGKGSFTLCFDVDKKYNTYTLQVGGREIGSIDLTNNNQPVIRGANYRPETEGMGCSRLLTQAEKDANPNRIQDGLSGTIVNGECVTNESIKDILINSEENNQGFSLDSFFRGLDDMIASIVSFFEEKIS